MGGHHEKQEHRHFDDFRVGDRGALERVVSAGDIDRFVELTGDDNPVHVDDAFARSVGIAGRVVHGMLTAGFVSTIIGTILPGSGALWLSESFNFRAPVLIGDRIAAEVVVRHVSPATRVLVLTVEVRNQHGKVVLDGEARVQVLEPMSDQAAVRRGANTVVVTGAGRGIGAAIARRLAAEGLRVVINYRSDEAQAADTANSIKADGGDVVLVRADVTDPDDVSTLMTRATDAYGPIEALVNNAGGPTLPKAMPDLSWAEVDAHLASHLRGAFLCVSALLPDMLERGFGRIVNVTSQSAYGQPPPKMAGYVIAKAALAAFTRCIALEAAPRGVTANAVAPGMTDTTLVSDVPQRTKLAVAAQTPLRRLGMVEDVADAVSFLVGPAGSSVTGQTIHLSGGQVMP